MFPCIPRRVLPVLAVVAGLALPFPAQAAPGPAWVSSGPAVLESLPASFLELGYPAVVRRPSEERHRDRLVAAVPDLPHPAGHSAPPASRRSSSGDRPDTMRSMTLSICAYSAGSRISLISIRTSPAARSSLTRGQFRAMRSLRKELLRLPHVIQMIRGGGPRRSWISTKSLSFVMTTASACRACS
jgi:hypothetical protein